ncbi:hypothetical protein HU200_035396 [Digitaria exilis]|uniref:Cytochrome P450 n=1 Tax=Digitaria exilis TaxID=1010633 RepID=A0A835BHC8_9POAL|nr:hypothetical protein HU200_035396 [Digitaria exilis]CAB3495287.1 unnamed protein product [Digitaria exilis]
MGGGTGMVGAVLAVAMVMVPCLWAALAHLVWRPYAVARTFARQGVRGPPYRFFVGNTVEAKAMRTAAVGEALDRGSHDIIPRVLPHYHAWASRYGKVFVSWSGTTPTLCAGRLDMVKRVLSDKTGLYVKPDPGPTIMSLLEMGLVFTEGDDWARHRRVHIAQGKEVFLAQRELQHIALAAVNSVRIPGAGYLPTKANVRRWRLERTVRDTLMGIIGERLAAATEAGRRGYGTDLLGLMLEANAGGEGGKSVMSMDEIVDECKTFFFAGHDTTAHLLTWAMYLLGTHPEWQRRLREEVLQECGGTDTPLHGDALNKLKLVTMVLYETLRLYGAVNMIVREAREDTELCGVKVPKGTVVAIPIAMLHRDEEGADAGEFDPLRFRDGVGRAAAHPSALLSFSFGPRSCIGQDFAMLEAKATLALILRRFAFEVAPEYVHAPADFLTLQPLKGLQIVLRLLDPEKQSS